MHTATNEVYLTTHNTRDEPMAMPTRRPSIFTSSWASAPELLVVCPSASPAKMMISTTKATQRGVRFAPAATTITIIGLGLDDYTTEEHEACWYSRAELSVLRKRNCHRISRGHLTCGHPFCCQIRDEFKDARWTA